MDIETLVGGPLANNTYLVAAPMTGQTVVIDPALGLARRIAAAAQRREWAVGLIVATHRHWDHIADIARLAAATGAAVAAHRLDALGISQPSRPLYLPEVELRPAAVARLLEDGDALELGGLRLDVLHTPGHTPGGICLYAAAEGVLFTGDTLFAGSCGRTDLPGGDEAAMLKSLRRLAALPAATRVLPGHGPETTIGGETWLLMVNGEPRERRAPRTPVDRLNSRT